MHFGKLAKFSPLLRFVARENKNAATDEAVTAL